MQSKEEFIIQQLSVELANAKNQIMSLQYDINMMKDENKEVSKEE